MMVTASLFNLPANGGIEGRPPGWCIAPYSHFLDEVTL